MSVRDEFKEKVKGQLLLYTEDSWGLLTDSEKHEYENFAEAVLLLQDSGHRLAIVKEGAELPENPHPRHTPNKGIMQPIPGYDDLENRVYREGQQSLVDAHWVQEVPSGD